MYVPVRTLTPCLFLAALPALVTAASTTAPAQQGPPGVERQSLFPNNKHQALPGKVIGILAVGDENLLKAEGRTGPRGVLYFSTGGSSYRFLYVPDKKKPLIGGLNVRVDDKGTTRRFDYLGLATLETLRQWGVSAPYTLVELEVNGGHGSPSGEPIIATGVKVLEGTPPYQFKAAEVVEAIRQQHAAAVQQQSQDVESEMREARRAALKDRPATGPREKSDVIYVSWLPQTQRLQVRLQTRISDGAYKSATTLEDVFEGLDKPVRQVEKQVRYGTSFGVLVGTAYEVSRTGKVEQSRKLPIERFQQEIPPPLPRPAREP